MGTKGGRLFSSGQPLSSHTSPQFPECSPLPEPWDLPLLSIRCWNQSFKTQLSYTEATGYFICFLNICWQTLTVLAAPHTFVPPLGQSTLDFPWWAIPPWLSAGGLWLGWGTFLSPEGKHRTQIWLIRSGQWPRQVESVPVRGLTQEVLDKLRSPLLDHSLGGPAPRLLPSGEWGRSQHREGQASGGDKLHPYNVISVPASGHFWISSWGFSTTDHNPLRMPIWVEFPSHENGKSLNWQGIRQTMGVYTVRGSLFHCF